MQKENYVDITKELTVVEWFTGYGGNELGLRRVLPAMRPIAFCERESFVVANLVAKMEAGLMDPVPIWTDVTDFPCEPFGHQQLDFFAASYPCQGFSHAGKRLGKDDPRHLWPYCRKFIQRVRPGWVWLENVEGHVSLGLSTVLSDLEEDGYTAAWGIFSASEIGAPHQRKRVFILAYDMRRAEQKLPWGGEPGGTGSPKSRSGVWPGASGGDSGGCSSEGVQGAAAGVLSEDVAHQFNEGLQGHSGDVNREGREPRREGGPVAEEGLCGNVWPSRPGESQYAWEPPRVVGNTTDNGYVRDISKLGHDIEGAVVGGVRWEERNGETGEPPREQVCQTQPALGGNSDGPASGLDFPGCTGLSDTELEEIYGWMVKGTNRTDELRMCGNGVVPQTAERAFRVLYAELLGARESLVMEDL